ncbi:hypothetical protein BH022_22375 [Salmonella enterica]|nr:hypothetical protein [Salmonella enterica]EBO4352145.1 hypothetical protein [Salmonella enterica]
MAIDRFSDRLIPTLFSFFSIIVTLGFTSYQILFIASRERNQLKIITNINQINTSLVTKMDKNEIDDQEKMSTFREKSALLKNSHHEI